MTSEAALSTFPIELGTTICQARPPECKPVTTEAPALEVMTDLNHTRAAVAPASTPLREAEHLMLHQGVQMLFVIGDAFALEGMVTLTDLHGERQMRLVHQRDAHYDDLTVGDVMTHLSMLDAIDFRRVNVATVGNVIATLEKFGRTHLLVVEREKSTGKSRVRGILSSAQVERQSGHAISVAPVASTFAEVERALF